MTGAQTTLDFAKGYVQKNTRGGSRAAAERRVARPGSWTRQVLELIARPEGATDDECEVALGYASARKRRLELEERGLVIGGRYLLDGRVSIGNFTRPTRWGLPAQVWVVTDAGRAAL